MNRSYYYLEMKTHHLEVPYLKKKRRIRVLLPKNYDAETEHYPVVYMHDGQNVFYSKEAYSGHSWKVIHTLKKNPDLPKMIIVGIDNDHDNRMNEYSAWDYTTAPSSAQPHHYGGRGTEYAEFVMETVKPFIDQQYRTKVDKEYTAMIGSSLGGNITQFMGVKYQAKIGNLGVFSSAMWLSPEAFARYIKRQPLSPTQRIFIQVGTKEGDDVDRTLVNGNIRQLYIDASLTYYQQLLQKDFSQEQINLNIVADAKHNEQAWARFLPECLRFLSENW